MRSQFTQLNNKYIWMESNEEEEGIIKVNVKWCLINRTVLEPNINILWFFHISFVHSGTNTGIEMYTILCTEVWTCTHIEHRGWYVKRYECDIILQHRRIDKIFSLSHIQWSVNENIRERIYKYTTLLVYSGTYISLLYSWSSRRQLLEDPIPSWIQIYICDLQKEWNYGY